MAIEILKKTRTVEDLVPEAICDGCGKRADAGGDPNHPQYPDGWIRLGGLQGGAVVYDLGVCCSLLCVMTLAERRKAPA